MPIRMLFGLKQPQPPSASAFSELDRVIVASSPPRGRAREDNWGMELTGSRSKKISLQDLIPPRPLGAAEETGLRLRTMGCAVSLAASGFLARGRVRALP